MGIFCSLRGVVQAIRGFSHLGQLPGARQCTPTRRDQAPVARDLVSLSAAATRCHAPRFPRASESRFLCCHAHSPSFGSVPLPVSGRGRVADLPRGAYGSTPAQLVERCNANVQVRGLRSYMHPCEISEFGQNPYGFLEAATGVPCKKREACPGHTCEKIQGDTTTRASRERSERVAGLQKI